MRATAGDGGSMVIFACPGCDSAHQVPVRGDRSKGPVWEWNGSLDLPTFKPSIRILNYRGAEVSGICHSFVTAGRIQFCGDSTHKLKGQTVDLPDWETW